MNAITTSAATSTSQAMPDFSGQTGVTTLTDWGVIRATGADAAKFLHGQLTQDVSLLGMSEARLAAFCSAKGRMLASFVVFKLGPQDIALVCKRDLLAPTLKRLSMFVMRAQCKLSDASDAFELLGVTGDNATQLALACGLGRAAWATAQVGTSDAPTAAADSGAPMARVVRLPAGAARPGASAMAANAVCRLLWCAPVGTARPQALVQAPEVGLEAWNSLEVASGVAMVSQAVAEAFVPQMLNYESVGGVNFKKGCYPGQEVVARSQYRGTLKRRAYVVGSALALHVGQEVFHASDASQPCGTVAAAAPLGQGGWVALVSMQTSAADGQSLTSGGPEGPTLTLFPLPYTLLEDI